MPKPDRQLEPLTAANLPEVVAALRDPAGYTHIPGSLPASDTALHESLAAMLHTAQTLAPPRRWAHFLLRGDGVAMGRLEAYLQEDRAEVAILLGPQWWGQGYAQQALSMLHDWLMEQGITSAWAAITPGNLRSRRLFERSGYVWVDAGWPTLGSYDDGDWVFSRRLP